MIFDGLLISNPDDVLYKMLIYMQQWRMLVKSRDRSLLNVAMEEIKRLNASLREQARVFFSILCFGFRTCVGL
jgi:hypothetical protein